MTISIQRIAWTGAAVGGMFVSAFAVQLPLSSEAGVSEYTSANDLGALSTAAEAKPVGASTPDDAASRKRQAAESASPSQARLPTRRTAAYRRAKRMIELGRKAVENRQYRRAKQLARLAESTGARFEESDPDHPARLRDAIAEAVEAAIQKQAVTSSAPTKVSARAAEPVEKPAGAQAASQSSAETEQPPLTRPVVSAPSVIMTADASETSAPSATTTEVAETAAPSREITVRAKYDEVVTPRPARPPIAVEQRSAEPAESESKKEGSDAPRAPEFQPASQPHVPQTTAGPASPPAPPIRPQPAQGLSRAAVSQRLLQNARQAIQQGDLDGAAALALRAKGLTPRHSTNADNPDRVLRQIVELNRRGMSLPSRRESSRGEPSFPPPAEQQAPSSPQKENLSAQGPGEKPKSVRPRSEVPVGRLQTFIPPHPRPTWKEKDRGFHEASDPQTGLEIVTANTDLWRSAPVTVTYRDATAASETPMPKQTIPEVESKDSLGIVQAAATQKENRDVNRTPAPKRPASWKASYSTNQNRSTQADLNDQSAFPPPTPDPPLPVAIEPPTTYAPEGSEPQENQQEENADETLSLDAVPPLHVEPANEFVPVYLHEDEFHGRIDWPPYASRQRCSHCRKLSFWGKLVRFLHHSHRRIPVGLPENHNGLAGYSPTRWQRLPSPSHAPWSTMQPTLSEEPSEEDLPESEVPSQETDPLEPPSR